MLLWVIRSFRLVFRFVESLNLRKTPAVSGVEDVESPGLLGAEKRQYLEV